MKRGDWCKLHCGDKVFDPIDERHVGTIRAIVGFNVTVVWANGFESILPLTQVKHVRERDPKWKNYGGD